MAGCSLYKLVSRHKWLLPERPRIQQCSSQHLEVSVGGHAVDPEVGSKVLLEGNYFNTVQPFVI
ncbi:hypothetical protein CVT25_010070 [Psilocybe cyanescens]|uniref:Uncharacterized protein n=1 Tax=Psilocybe cyanescens TaxID=93625 RepID=A0A409X3G7_PSICY|nr:hypothetical protein CVT25_010070 [Psilocybe cyanescens]